MANLLDALNSAGGSSPTGGTGDTTNQLATLLRAKSGKDTGAPTTALSSQQEQGAIAQTQQNIAPIKQQAAIQQSGQQQAADTVQQQTNQQLAGVGQQRQQNTVQTNIQTNSILQNLEQNKEKISANEYQAGLEQVGQNVRLQNQQYVDNLNREGDKARLNDSTQFQQQLAQDKLGDNYQLLQQQLGDKSILNVDQNTWLKSMSNMDAQTAWTMFQNTAANDNSRALYSSLGALATAGVGAVGNALNKQNNTTSDNGSISNSGSDRVFDQGTSTSGDISTGNAGVLS